MAHCLGFYRALVACVHRREREREITMVHVILSSAKAQNTIAFNPTFSLISCDSFSLSLFHPAKTLVKKWHHKMKCRRKQQLNNYIQCNLLTNRNSYLLACILRQIHLMAGPYFFAQFTLISCIESLDFSFADTQDYVPNFRGCSVRFGLLLLLLLMMVVDGTVCTFGTLSSR